VKLIADGSQMDPQFGLSIDISGADGFTACCFLGTELPALKFTADGYGADKSR
jgi:hypothetical protein